MLHVKPARTSAHLLQGDLIQGASVPIITGITEQAGEPFGTISLIETAWILVLTQDCDLDLDHAARNQIPTQGQSTAPRLDRALRGIVVVPGFSPDTLFAGTHIPGAVTIPSKRREAIRNNELAPWYYVAAADGLLPEAVAFELKLFSTVPAAWAEEQWLEKRVATLDTPWKEHATRRFTEYFGRIALP